MIDNTFDERRSHVRMRIDTFVTFTVMGRDGQNHKGESHNLSADGLRMSTDVPLDVGDEIHLTLNSSDERLPPFLAKGVVVRRETSQHSFHPLYDVSLSFTETQ